MSEPPPPVELYERLAALIERELELAGQGRYADLEALAAERAALVASLPPTPPPAAALTLRRCELLQRRVTVELLRGRDQLVHQLAALRIASRAAAGYDRPRVGAPFVSTRA